MGGGRIHVLDDGDLTLRSQLILNPTFLYGFQDWAIHYSGTPLAYGPVPILRDGFPHLRAQVDSHRSAIRQKINVATANDSVTTRVKLQRSSGFPGKPMRAVVYVSKTNYALSGGTIIYQQDVRLSGVFDVGIVEAEVDLGAGYTGDVYLEIVAEPWPGESSYYSVLEATMTVDITNAGPVTPMAIPYSDAELDAVQYVQNPYAQQIVFTHPDHYPHALTFATGSWTFATLATITGAPAWTGATGYPRACGAFQGRLLLGGWTDDPQRVVGSHQGQWDDFTVVTQNPTTHDGLDFTLTAIGVVQWINGQKELLIGTVNAEHLVTSATGIVQAGDIDIRKQSAYGSRHQQPVDVGDQVLYVTPDGRSVRASEYSRDTNGWLSMDMTFASEHLTKAGIRRSTYTRDPNQLIWSVSGDGRLLGMSYERSVDIFGWHQHSTHGQFIDCCTQRINGIDVSVFLVRRHIDGEWRMYVETMQNIDEHSVYMDCHQWKYSAAKVSVVTGLEALEGMPVDVLNDGAYEKEKVVESGQITLDNPGNSILVGLNCAAGVITMPAAVGVEIGGMGAKRSYSRIGLRVVDSAIPKINGKRPAERDPRTAMDTPEAPLTGDVFTISTGWDNYGYIWVVQDLPLPLNLTGIYGRLSAKNV